MSSSSEFRAGYTAPPSTHSRPSSGAAYDDFATHAPSASAGFPRADDPAGSPAAVPAEEPPPAKQRGGKSRSGLFRSRRSAPPPQNTSDLSESSEDELPPFNAFAAAGDRPARQAAAGHDLGGREAPTGYGSTGLDDPTGNFRTATQSNPPSYTPAEPDRAASYSPAESTRAASFSSTDTSRAVDHDTAGAGGATGYGAGDPPADFAAAPAPQQRRGRRGRKAAAEQPDTSPARAAAPYVPAPALPEIPPEALQPQFRSVNMDARPETLERAPLIPEPHAISAPLPHPEPATPPLPVKRAPEKKSRKPAKDDDYVDWVSKLSGE